MKTYHHVFATNRRAPKDERVVWFHEASRDTRDDALDDKDGLTRDGYRVKIVKSAGDPLVMLAKMNAESI